MQPCLIVDTSIFGTYIALKDFSQKDNEVLWSCNHLERNGSTQAMTRILKQGLKKLELTMNDIDRIFVSSGPGSFTGIKVGIAWCQGLAAGSKDKRIHSFSSISELAKNLKKEKKIDFLNLMLPVTKTHGFLVSVRDSVSTELINVEIAEDKKDFLNSVNGKNNFVVINWPGVEPILETEGIQYNLLSVADVARHSISGASDMISQLEESIESEKFVKPNYMRKSTAEERLEKLKGAN